MFFIQDDRFSRSLTTHEAILTAATSIANTITCGGGVFAFATAGGVSLVFEDIVLRSFLAENPFTLIVGIDDITNTNTLDKLQELKNLYHPNLEVKVFNHNDSSSLFHPKFVWFKTDGEIKLIAGSGNLTEKGLRRNKEAFTITSFRDSELEDFEEYWNLWLSENISKLSEIDDEEVIMKATINSMRFTRTRIVDTEEGEEALTSANVEEQPVTVGERNVEFSPEIEVIDTMVTSINIETEDYNAWTIDDNPEVFVGEIPNNNSRWKQANFSRIVFEDFFGGIAGVNEERRILIRHVGATGMLEEVEVRPTVSVVSQNYRVELNAAGGLSYPIGNHRPIGIFIKVATRSFIYSLVMPEDVNYNEVLSYLNNSVPRVQNRMSRHVANVEELRRNCPNLSFWLI